MTCPSHRYAADHKAPVLTKLALEPAGDKPFVAAPLNLSPLHAVGGQAPDVEDEALIVDRLFEHSMAFAQRVRLEIVPVGVPGSRTP